jgi:N6-L-threonylcarbamoyladenine synthase
MQFIFCGSKDCCFKRVKKINGEDELKYNLAASFQNTINKILYKKTKVAVEMFRKKTKRKKFQLIIAGGVAANKSIRNNLSNLSREMDFKTVYPDLQFCGDNAAMIAWAGIQRFKKKLIDSVDVPAKSRWPLDKDAPYMKGPGLKL